MSVKIIECPRDAMQSLSHIVPTELKTAYLQRLLSVGFDTLDFGSFVSPKAVPQLADTAEVLAGLDLSATRTKLLAIVANLRGAESAAAFPEIDYLGYPFSISETFQLRNTRKTIAESVALLREIIAICADSGKEAVVYISMGFGNPYGDAWSPEIAADYVAQVVDMGAGIVSLADTVGTADTTSIGPMFSTLIPRFPNVEFGAHFHAHPRDRKAKLQAAWDGGCRRFDSAIMGFGGCPFAEDELVGNIATESLLEFLREADVDPGLDSRAFGEAMSLATQVFNV